MAYETFLYEKKEHIALLTMNRPNRLNAFDTTFIHDMRAILEDADADDDIRCLVVTGAPRSNGQPCFCAGGDLKETGRLSTFLLEVNDCFNRLEDMGKPSIAAIDGVCTAGGIEIAEVCDIRVAAETAQISDFHLLNLGGGLGGAGASTRLPRIVGLARAKQLIFTGEVWDGKKAKEMGFVNEVFPPDKLMEGAMEMARKIARMRPQGVRTVKWHMNMGLQMDLKQALYYSFHIRDHLKGWEREEEREEGRIAFREKRRPRWEQE